MSYAAVLDKAKMNITPKLYSGKTLYNYVIKEFLLRLELTSVPNIVIDGVYDKKQAQRMRTYLRQALKKSSIERSKISFVDSR